MPRASVAKERSAARAQLPRPEQEKRAPATWASAASAEESPRATAASPRRAAIVVGGIVALILGITAAWFVWANPIGWGPHAIATDTGFSIDGDNVTVMFDVSITPDHAAACAVKALDKGFAVVGWKVITYAASSVDTRHDQVTLRVISPAVTGLVSSCWLT